MFEEIFDNLNDKQKQAVKKTEGPLMVIAGPGTGKTQLLSARVAYILENTDVDARNILCLTFTNKAVHNMTERIIKITSGKAAKVNVKTFHSFASEIINAYPDAFWNNAKLSAVPDAVADEIIISILDKLPVSSPLASKFANKYTLLRDLKTALKLAKEAGLTPDKLKAVISANLNYIELVEPELTDIANDRLSYKKLTELQKKVNALPEQEIDELIKPLTSLAAVIKSSLARAIKDDEDTNKAQNTSKWKSRWIKTEAGKKGMHDERRRNLWWLEVADFYQKYRNTMHERGFYDYADMLVEVLTALENNPSMLADIQERFNYVMIDEFQDTNAAQLRLAHLVADHHTSEGKPNIMVVGDDDQSIFKFNGAELDNLIHFKNYYNPFCEIVVLTDNYRSSQAILDLSQKVIELCEVRVVNLDKSLNKHLIAQNNINNTEQRYFQFDTQISQYEALAHHIKTNYSQDQTTAVIARNNSSLREIAARLIELKVPVSFEQQSNTLDQPLVKQVILLSKIVTSINRGDLYELNVSLHESLKHPMWGLSARELWQMALVNYYDPDWLGSLERSEKPENKKHVEYILELAKIVANENLVVSLEYVLGLKNPNDHSSVLNKHFIKNTPDDFNQYLNGLSAIHYLRDLVHEFSPQNQPNLEDFVNYVDQQIANEEIISDESLFVSGSNAVQLLSVHKSKGLEFNNVYIIDAVQSKWSPRSNSRTSPANLPLQANGDEEDDYIRLMYVAITRAKQNVYISNYQYDNFGKNIAPSQIISSVMEPNDWPDKISPITILENALRFPRLQAADEKEMLKKRLQNYTLSVTHLLNFLDLSRGGPDYFVERNILRLPESKSSYMAYGTAAHAALEAAQKLTNQDSFNIEKVYAAYKKSLYDQKLPFNETEKYLEHGQSLIEKLFNGDFLILKKDSLPEQNLKPVNLGDAMLSGQLDRIDELNSEIVVSDYKTGKPLHSFSTTNKTLTNKAWRQKTQLIFYAILLQNNSRIDVKNKQMIGQMIYLDAENPKDFIRSYTPSQNEIDEISRLAQIVYQKIINYDLPNVSKYQPDFNGTQQFIQDLLK